MAEDRPVDDPAVRLAELERAHEDLKTTLMARVSRRPTGTIEGSLLPAGPAGTLLCNGATPLRADYPALWQWVQDNGLVPEFFTNGDGSTTFGLPDFRGQVLMGAGTGSGSTTSLGDLVGGATATLVTGNLPSHNHSVAVNDHGAHNHGISGDGSHAGHHSGTVWGYSVNVGGGVGAAYVNTSDGFHNHGGADGNTNVSGHSLTQSNVGSSTPFDARQASRAVNFLIWT